MTDDPVEGSDDAETEGIDPARNALSTADLRYPELSFPGEGIDPDGSIDLDRDLTREEMADWLDDLTCGLASHDVAVESADGYATLGVAPAGVSVRFDPDDDHRGDLEISFRLKASALLKTTDSVGITP